VAHKKKIAEEQEINLPITPMLDMSFQLMAFFILTFRPMPQEGQLPIELPKLAEVGGASDPLIPTDDKPDEYLVNVETAQGTITGVTLKKQGEGSLTPIGGDPIQGLYAELNKIAKPEAKKPIIKLEVGNDLKYERLIDLMDACKAGGFDSIGVGPHPKEGS
jgi:biopolymer transport protein ExbD